MAYIHILISEQKNRSSFNTMLKTGGKGVAIATGISAIATDIASKIIGFSTLQSAQIAATTAVNTFEGALLGFTVGSVFGSAGSALVDKVSNAARRRKAKRIAEAYSKQTITEQSYAQLGNLMASLPPQKSPEQIRYNSAKWGFIFGVGTMIIIAPDADARAFNAAKTEILHQSNSIRKQIEAPRPLPLTKPIIIKAAKKTI